MTDCCLRVLSKNDLQVQVAETINVTQRLMYTQLPIAETRIHQGSFIRFQKLYQKSTWHQNSGDVTILSGDVTILSGDVMILSFISQGVVHGFSTIP